MPRITFVLFVLLAVGLLFGMSPDTDPGATPTETTQPTETTNADADRFLTVLATHDLSFERNDSAVAVGSAVCGALDSGVTPSDTATLLVSTLHLVEREAQLFILTSVDSLCPRNRDR
ncbi:MAG: DUF732 domain-containing protein [Rhodococcus sp.]|nr:DUF732 domain-containing protein [Rhodococcus sp. (in: high G+C Gram-positive bacteria)]